MLGAAGIGVKDDHRVPDLTLLRPPIQPQWQPTAALAVEVLSWREPAAKELAFYAAHQAELAQRIDWDRGSSPALEPRRCQTTRSPKAR